MEWSEVIDNPMFANLPFKIELNRFGKLLMSPASNAHGRIQSRLGAKLLQHGGEVVSECSVLTTDGVKVADLAWLSDEFVNQFGFITPYPQAPELCVEIVSPSNSTQEMLEKVSLYLESGAVEVWIVYSLERIEMFNRDGTLVMSELLPRLDS